MIRVLQPCSGSLDIVMAAKPYADMDLFWSMLNFLCQSENDEHILIDEFFNKTSN